jgi:hypothetical protein
MQECAHSWVDDDIQFWVCQHSTSHYALGVLYFVVRVDTNSEIDPAHVLKTFLLDLSKM